MREECLREGREDENSRRVQFQSRNCMLLKTFGKNLSARKVSPKR